MAAALAEIETAFDQAAAVNNFKLRVERLVRLGVQHPAVRARFAARAALLAGCDDLGGAIVIVERWWREERKALQIASLFGHGNRLSLETLRELRLILRLLRYRRKQAEFSAIIAALLNQPTAIAAE
jgi:hypothetical protein